MPRYGMKQEVYAYGEFKPNFPNLVGTDPRAISGMCRSKQPTVGVVTVEQARRLQSLAQALLWFGKRT